MKNTDINKDKEFAYKGFETTMKFSELDNCFFGKIENINDLVNFDGKDEEDFKFKFKKAVDDYIDLCCAIGKQLKNEHGELIND